VWNGRSRIISMLATSCDWKMGSICSLPVFLKAKSKEY